MTTNTHPLRVRHFDWFSEAIRAGDGLGRPQGFGAFYSSLIPGGACAWASAALAIYSCEIDPPLFGEAVKSAFPYMVNQHRGFIPTLQ